MVQDHLKTGRGNIKSKIAYTFFVINFREISNFYGKINDFFVKSFKRPVDLQLFIFYSSGNSEHFISLNVLDAE